MSKANMWFVPGEGIAREVITADIQRYLGPDALVKPGVGNAGEYEGRPGYWITAYRTLTSAMIQDLKLDSGRWQEEQQGRLQSGRGGSPYTRDHKVSRQPDTSLVAQYQDSRTHAARQHWGPSAPYAQTEREQPPPPQPATQRPYGTSNPYSSGSEPGYTSTPNPSSTYVSPPYSAPQAPNYTPRTAPDPYAQSRETAGYRPQNAYAYQQQAPQEPFRATPATSYSQPSNVAQPGYYLASDGREYPLNPGPRRTT
ncbi:hypothetical protein P154DRAFT_63253 [Amniculicola lignicola CBS 123094]|uniref:Uncharacterized protein n=1 Tax=Amniculicola lignicola CBS 123094 TaxID=1392246 RepID=A0A6A5WXY9_9PLEO|nr:hypothetical protein P154DRAFT_63253 [Amniculicola lignicola CBS 123094]